MRHYREAHFPVVQVSPSSLVVLREKYIARAAPSCILPRRGRLIWCKLMYTASRSPFSRGEGIAFDAGVTWRGYGKHVSGDYDKSLSLDAYIGMCLISFIPLVGAIPPAPLSAKGGNC